MTIRVHLFVAAEEMVYLAPKFGRADVAEVAGPCHVEQLLQGKRCDFEELSNGEHTVLRWICDELSGFRLLRECSCARGLVYAEVGTCLTCSASSAGGEFRKLYCNVNTSRGIWTHLVLLSIS